MREDLDLLSLGVALEGGRSRRVHRSIVRVEVKVGTGNVGGDADATRAAVGETLSPGRIRGATAVYWLSGRED